MSRLNAGRSFASLRVGKLIRYRLVSYAVCALLVGGAAYAQNQHSAAEPSLAPSADAKQPSATDAVAQQADREAAFAKMLSGATLDGNFTMTGPDHDPTKLTHDKYTLGEVKKLDGKEWQIPARIQYGDHDFTLPFTLPIEWAGDTPVIVVENVGLPGYGGVSARVMFFADHYAGFWQHGTQGGHLFGVIRHDAARPATSENGDH